MTGLIFSPSSCYFYTCFVQIKYALHLRLNIVATFILSWLCCLLTISDVTAVKVNATPKNANDPVLHYFIYIITLIVLIIVLLLTLLIVFRLCLLYSLFMAMIQCSSHSRLVVPLNCRYSLLNNLTPRPTRLI